MDPEVEDSIDCQEIFELIKDLPDPEHPLTLEQLNVVNLEDIRVDPERQVITIEFTPTIPNCSSASFIGLYIKIKVERCVSQRYKKDVFVKKGTHYLEEQLNKQINDKQRVCAALENKSLRDLINQALVKSDLAFKVLF